MCVCVCEIERFDSIRFLIAINERLYFFALEKLYKHIKVVCVWGGGGGSGCTPVKQRQLVRLVSQLDLVTYTLYKLI